MPDWKSLIGWGNPRFGRELSFSLMFATLAQAGVGLVCATLGVGWPVRRCGLIGVSDSICGKNKKKEREKKFKWRSNPYIPGWAKQRGVA